MQENNIKQTEEIKVGQYVSIITNACSEVMGLVTMIADYINNENMVKKIYRIRINDNSYIDFSEDMISCIEILNMNSKEYLQDFQAKYEIECFDDEGGVEHISTIINNALIKNVWEKLDDVEKCKLIENLFIGNDDTVDLINSLDKSRKKNNELHKKVCELTNQRIKTCNAVIEFQKRFDEVSNLMPSYKWAYDFVYDYLGIDKLLKEV